ncbi:hypothetical protein M432DRAFT_586610 [Thermoascus aurantiacus ATCC 26904]
MHADGKAKATSCSQVLVFGRLTVPNGPERRRGLRDESGAADAPANMWIMDPRGMDKYSPPLYAHVLRNDGSRQVIPSPLDLALLYINYWPGTPSTDIYPVSLTARATSSLVIDLKQCVQNLSGSQFHYQLGIRTYVTTNLLFNTGLIFPIKYLYLKNKDSPIGSPFGDHVMGEDGFLMRLYSRRQYLPASTEDLRASKSRA